MVITSLELSNYRNYQLLTLPFDSGTNILYGDNAQGKTNILEAVYLCATTKSHRGSKDQDIIRFGEEEAHIRTRIFKNGDETRIDMHLRRNKSKGIAIDGSRIRKASQLLGLLHVVFFSPEDLCIIKNGPSERRRFMDMELCQMDAAYLHHLNQYNKVVNQRNRLLKDYPVSSHLSDMLDVWDAQLLTYGREIIVRRAAFVEELDGIITGIHNSLSGGREHLKVAYEPSVEEERLEEALFGARERDIALKMSTIGPHRDDISFQIDGIDVRRYGSQGQQRTAALSLKLSEIELVKKTVLDTPVLLLDDVLSELDSGRQRYLLNSLGQIQTIITCTGLDEFVNNRFEINKVFRIDQGRVVPLKEPGRGDRPGI